MLKTLKKFAVGAALVTASAASFANLPFTFDSTSVGGTQFEAAIMTGFYNEVIEINPGTGDFMATVLLDFTSFKDVNNSGLRGTGLGIQYGLYSVININGTLVSGSPNFATGGWTGDISLFIDPNFDTESNNRDSLVGVGSTNLVGDTEDLTLFTGTIARGESNGTAQSASFSLTSVDIELDPVNGNTFFTAPDPFYNFLLSFGQLEDFFAQVDFNSSDMQRFAGEANVRFVPEPSAIALLGLGIFGLAFATRKAK